MNELDYGMREVANTVIKDAKEAGTRIAIWEKGKVLKLTPKQMRDRIKKSKKSKT